MKSNETFYLQKENIYAVPIIHYNMELAAQVRLAFQEIQPDCVAVEFAETMQLRLLHAASRLPDISLVMTYDQDFFPLYYMCEPCDGGFEALRSALEKSIPAFCIDLDVDFYPDIFEPLPDPYAVHRIGLKNYYEIYKKNALVQKGPVKRIDQDREMYMAHRLKALSYSYDKILFVGGMAHVENVLKLIDRKSFPALQHAQRDTIDICTFTEKSCREVMAEPGWMTKHYEEARASGDQTLFPPDRQKIIYQLYKTAGEKYSEKTGNPFPGYNMRNIMKFSRNYSLVSNQLMPDLFQILTTAKGCVDHNYAYETWELATEYPFRKNIDGFSEIDLSPQEIWKHSKLVKFNLKEKGRKELNFKQRRKGKEEQFRAPNPFNICSYPPEDQAIERFGEFLKKKAVQILTEDSARTVPFSTSLEDGIDTRETIRHWSEKKLFVKTKGKPTGRVGSLVVIFDEDHPLEGKPFHENFPWKTTWIGEHAQESDMAFYATHPSAKVVGPGISRCEYGGFMMSYPPRRMFDIWTDPDYDVCQSKSEVLLMAAIDYALQPVVVYVGSRPPRSFLKSFAKRFGKKIVYIPIGQLSPLTLNKLRAFHVLGGLERRIIADDYIF
jgi:hypothetical protein